MKRKRIKTDPELVATTAPARYSELQTDLAYIKCQKLAGLYGLIDQATAAERVERVNQKHRTRRLMGSN